MEREPSTTHDAETATDATDAALPGDRVEALLVAQRAQFLAFLERRLGSRDRAEEILQEAYARGLDKRAALRDDESATAWFYRILRNAIADHARRRDAERRAVERAAHEPEPANEAPDAGLMDTVCRCVGGLVDTLKPEYADAVRAVELGGRPLREYAEAAGITPNNAAVRLFRARESLRQKLTRACGACATHGCRDCACHATKHGRHEG